MKLNKKKGFTLAEVLITLTIIGVIAAILFPSILANYNERTLKAKRQALVARMSQAMANLADQFGNYESVKNADGKTTCSTKPLDCADDGSALKFINEGLSKVYKLAAVCDNETLSACDFPNEITRQDGSVYSFADIKTLGDYNEQISFSANGMPYNTDIAAFMTKNGESILLFYNPRCTGSTGGSIDEYAEAKMCINMVYDLNGGKKKPNRLGEDIGVLTSIYSNSPSVASPKLIDANKIPEYSSTVLSDSTIVEYTTNAMTFNQAKAACAMLGENVVLPSKEEAISLMINWELLRDRSDMQFTQYMWTSTMSDPTKVWAARLNMPRAATAKTGSGLYLTFSDPDKETTKYYAKCVYAD